MKKLYLIVFLFLYSVLFNNVYGEQLDNIDTNNNVETQNLTNTNEEQQEPTEEHQKIEITSVYPVSIRKNAIHTNDKVFFKILNNVYIDEKVYIQADSRITGKVSSVGRKGFLVKTPYVVLDRFYARDVDNNIIIINSKLELDGIKILEQGHSKIYRFLLHPALSIRSLNVKLKPNYYKFEIEL